MFFKRLLLKVTPRFIKNAIKILIKNIVSDEITDKYLSRVNLQILQQKREALLQVKRHNFQFANLALTRNDTDIYHFPLLAYIETSQKCNLKCIMCPGHSFKESVNSKLGDYGILTLETFNRLLPFLPYLNRCILSGDGEPLLNPDLMEIIKKVKDFGISTGFITNGTLLNKTLSDKLLDLQVDQITFSIDSLDEEIFEKIRVKSRFKKVMENLSYLIAEKARRKSKMPNITISAVLMKENYKEIRRFIEFAANGGIKQVFFSPLFWYPDKSYLSFYDEHNLSTDEIYELKKSFPKLVEFAQTKDIELDIKFSPGFNPDENKNQPTNDLVCTEPWTTIFITWDGEIRPCCSSEMTFGSLNQNRIEDIWFSKKYSQLRKEISSGKIKNRFCENCLKNLRQKNDITEIKNILY